MDDREQRKTRAIAVGLSTWHKAHRNDTKVKGSFFSALIRGNSSFFSNYSGRFGKWQVRVQDGSKRCHCERSEAISALQKGDCFASLAMTG